MYCLACIGPREIHMLLGTFCCSITKLYPTLCDPMDCGTPGSSVHGVLQAILEWLTISFSRGSSQTRDQTHIFCIGRQILYH